MIKLRLFKGTTLLDEIEIGATYVPRVGEIINLHGHPNFPDDYKDPLDFIVCNVSHENKDNILTPELRCLQWFGRENNNNERTEILTAWGWL